MLEFFAALWLVGAGATARAEDPPTLAEEEGPIAPVDGRLRARVRPFADGLVREGEWGFVHAEVASGLPTDQAWLGLGEPLGEDRAEVQYGRRFELTRGARKVLPGYWLVGPGMGARRFSLRPDREEGGYIGLPLRAVDPEEVALVVIGDDALGLQTVRAAWSGGVPGRRPRAPVDGERRVWVGVAPLASLPERSAGWGAFDYVIWPEAQPSRATPGALQALRHWVADGGNLFLTVSDRWADVRSSPLEPLLPLDLLGSEPVTIADATRRLGGPASAEATATPVARGAVRPGAWTLLVDDAGQPLWLLGRYGLGTVSVLLTNPAIAPLGTEIQRTELWRALLFLNDPQSASGAPLYRPFARLRSAPSGAQLGHALRARTPYGAWNGRWNEHPAPDMENRMREALGDVPGVAPVPLPLLLGFAFVYLLAIGPLDWWILRRLRRQPLTWVTFPVMVVLFSSFVLVGTRLYKGSQAVAVRLEAVDVLGDTGLWRGQTWLGLFSTRRSLVRVSTLEADAVIQPLFQPGFMNAPAVTAEDASTSLSWQAETWTLGYARTTWVGPREGTVRVLASDEDSVELESTLPFTLSPAELHVGHVRVPLGALEPGRSKLALQSSTEEAGLDTNEPIVQLLREGLDMNRGSAELEGSAWIAGLAPAPIENLRLEGLSPESRQRTLVRVLLVPADRMGDMGWETYANLGETAFEEMR